MLLITMACLVSVSFGAFSSAMFYVEEPKDHFLYNKKKVAFSLHSGYKFRGDKVITNINNSNTSSSRGYINLNSIANYQMNNTTYTLNLKKKAFDGRITFNPNTTTR